MPTPFDSHQAALQAYLAWLNSFQGTPGTSSSTDLTTTPTFTWLDNDFSCNAKIQRKKMLLEGGYQILDVLTLTALEDMGDPGPVPLQMVTFNSEGWRIQIVQLATGKFPSLTCWNPNRGA